MWNDNDTNIDLVDFSHLVEASIGIIENKDLVPCTIGFYGDWGSGKSSLIKMVEQKFESNEKVLTIKFNGWLFEGYDDAKSVLMRTILEQIIKQRTFKAEAKDIAKRLYKQIDWMKLAKSAVGHGASFLITGGIGNIALGLNDLISPDNVKTGIKDIAENFSDGDYDKLIDAIKDNKGKSFQTGIRDFHKDFDDLLSETKIDRLIVFIDDLDRCNPDTVISTLEAIKLFLFVPKSTFIICADERLIKYAVRKRFPEIQGSNAEVGRDYLEKLIQYPIRIPAMDNLEMETYVNLLFCKLNLNDENFEAIREKVMENKRKELFSSIINHETISKFTTNVPKKLIEDLLLSSQITPLLTVGLNGNPRQCKRFLNMLLLRFVMAENKGIKIQKRTLAKLMLLEYFKPETFRLLSTIQAEQQGFPLEIKTGELLIEGNNTQISKELKIDIESLLTEDWFKKWFSIEPKLAKTDLRPYFYFSRDTLGVISTETSRMSSSAQSIYQKLVSESVSVVRKGLSDIKGISSAETASIFSSLGKKIRQEDDKVKANNYMKTLVQLAGSQKDLVSELLAFLKDTPDNLVAPAIIPELRKAIKNTAYADSGNKQIAKWAESSNKILAAIAQKQK